MPYWVSSACAQPAGTAMGNKPASQAVKIAAYLPGGVGLLPLPRGTTRLGQLPAFLMQTNQHLIARFVPNPFIAVKGTYNGLFYNADSLRNESSGFFTAITTDLGAFTAKLNLGGRVVPLLKILRPRL